MQRIIGTAVGKTVQQVTRLKKSGGQALPGWVVEKITPSYYGKMLAQLPDGVVVITGTNGKTTTTKMVVELLAANGKRVLTNPTGSNLTRGINSMLITQANMRGKLKFDIAVLELDEAYARRFAKQVPVRWVLALNVTRDQLDRFGEVDTAAGMIADTMAKAKEGIVVNADDPRLLLAAQKICDDKNLKLASFGVAAKLRHFFPTENELVSVDKTSQSQTNKTAVDVELADFKDTQATYKIDGQQYHAKLKITGQHNLQNAAAALALARQLVDASSAKLVDQLGQIKPAFGRGEVFKLANGTSLRMVLVKNPAGFSQALASYLPTNGQVMIAINDNLADGRDVSWLWDVDFGPLAKVKVWGTTGSRAADMAMRLSYDQVDHGQVQMDQSQALEQFCALPGDKLLFTTYTAMLWFYKTLSKDGPKS